MKKELSDLFRHEVVPDVSHFLEVQEANFYKGWMIMPHNRRTKSGIAGGVYVEQYIGDLWPQTNQTSLLCNQLFYDSIIRWFKAGVGNVWKSS